MAHEKVVQFSVVTIDQNGGFHGLLPLGTCIDTAEPIIKNSCFNKLIAAHTQGLIDNDTEIILTETVKNNVFDLEQMRDFSMQRLCDTLRNAEYAVTRTGIRLSCIERTINIYDLVQQIADAVKDFVAHNSIEHLDDDDLQQHDTGYAIISISAGTYEYITRTLFYKLENGSVYESPYYKRVMIQMIKACYGAAKERPLGLAILKYTDKLEEVLQGLMTITAMTPIQKDADREDIMGLLNDFITKVKEQESVDIELIEDFNYPLPSVRNRLQNIKRSHITNLLFEVDANNSLHDLINKH